MAAEAGEEMGRGQGEDLQIPHRNTRSRRGAPEVGIWMGPGKLEGGSTAVSGPCIVTHSPPLASHRGALGEKKLLPSPTQLTVFQSSLSQCPGRMAWRLGMMAMGAGGNSGQEPRGQV